MPGCGSRTCRNKRTVKAHVGKSKHRVHTDKCGKQFVKVPSQKDATVWAKRTVVEIDQDTTNSQSSPFCIGPCDFHVVIRSCTPSTAFTYWVLLPCKPKNAHPYVISAVAGGANSSIVLNILQQGVTAPRAILTATQTNPGIGTDFATDIFSPAVTLTPLCNKKNKYASCLQPRVDWVQTALTMPP